MPVVFVHGVSNRDTPEYRDNTRARDAFLRTYVVPHFVKQAIEVAILNPYWGDHGVKFRWGNASLPESFDPMETFGAGLGPAHLRIGGDIVAPLGPAAADIVTIAQRSLADAIDVVWAAALPEVETPEQAEALAESSRRAFDYAAAQPKPPWLATANNENFVDLLLEHVESYDQENVPAAPGEEVRWESFGAGSLLDDLKEGASRIMELVPTAMSTVATTLGRKKLHLGASMFLGDVFQYLTRRGERENPGPIVSTVLNAFHTANAKRSDTDPLIVIGHSLGGVVSYDILTYFQPDLEVDVFMTVGSQVALFEEMGMYKHPPVPADAPSERLVRPANIKHWLNVLDPNDAFSFRAEGVFEGVTDYAYETGYGLTQAHGGYFHRPSFYRRLGERLAQAIP
ncbi:MAG: hypothetical protein U9Q81_17805 [Pseudomonadota bacterium]|nr:hypothetical protein [Pseudomonadota bacterium]